MTNPRRSGSGGESGLPHHWTDEDWGNSVRLEVTRGELHGQMGRLTACRRGLEGRAREVPFLPAVAEYRRELLFHAALFVELSGAAPAHDALRQRY